MCSLDELLGPNDGVGVEVLGGIKPKPVPLLSAAFPSDIDVGVHGVGVAAGVPQEFEVDLIMELPCSLCHHLFPYGNAR